MEIWQDSNLRQTDYESVALTTELQIELEMGFEPTTPEANVQCSPRLSYTNRVKHPAYLRYTVYP